MPTTDTVRGQTFVRLTGSMFIIWSSNRTSFLIQPERGRKSDYFQSLRRLRRLADSTLVLELAVDPIRIPCFG